MIKIFIANIQTEEEAKDYEKGVNAFLRKLKIIKSVNTVSLDGDLCIVVWYQK